MVNKLSNAKQKSQLSLSILFILTLIILLIGTIAYSYLEGWNLLDSLFFSVTTLTAIGYGDMNPTNSLSKIFTIIYIFLGMGIVLALIKVISRTGGR
ncbi:MAG: potassium channel family protein [archaeon]